MKQYLVFHKTVDRFFEAQNTELSDGINMDNFTLICRVDLGDDSNCESVWEATNTKPWDTAPWFDADNVHLALNLEGARSLSVGDLVYDCTENELHEVAGIGFRKVHNGLLGE